MTDIRLQTPREIDTQLEALYLAAQVAENARTAALADLHYMLGERAQYVARGRRTWPTTDAQAIAAVEAKVAAGATTGPSYGFRPFTLDAYEAAVNTLATITSQQETFYLEFVRRGGWTRFFTVMTNGGGHVHSSMNCQTCNNGATPTVFGWTPKLSGLSEAEAVAQLGDYASSLCTVCYPSAPVEWTNGSANVKPACPGSGKPFVEGTFRRQGRGGWARCSGCATNQTVTQGGVIRKHAPAKAA